MTRYGMWPGVVAVVGDADVRCIPCARIVYGATVVAGVIDDEEGYVDREGNELGVILAGSEDQFDIDATPDENGCFPLRRCGRCGAELD